jgi:hypothetical protein
MQHRDYQCDLLHRNLQTRSWHTVIGVAAKQFGDQRGLVLEDLVGRAGVLALADISVAERSAGEHIDRPGFGAVGLASASVRRICAFSYSANMP